MKASILLFVLFVSCTSLREIPSWEGKIYAGDSKRKGISRKQSDEFIPSTSDGFDKFICISNEDFRSFYKTYVLRCKEWE